jgi:hypothetical protein
MVVVTATAAAELSGERTLDDFGKGRVDVD